MNTSAPTTTDPVKLWQARLREALGRRVAFNNARRVCAAKAVLDDTLKLGLYTADGQCLAVAHCSPEAAPEMAEHFVSRAEAARDALGPRLGSAIMRPIAVGQSEGLSYCVYPYRNPLRDGRVGRWLDRRQVRGPALAWLLDVNAATVHTPEDHGPVAGLETSLVSMDRLDGLNEPVRAAIASLHGQLASGDWKPVRVLQHGDFWDGNLLHAEPGDGDWPFVVIDWPGSRLDGVPIFDLVRFAMSVGLDAKPMGRQLLLHAEAIGCAPQDTAGHLVTALAHVADDLNHFPVERFVQMANRSVSMLNQALKAMGHSVGGCE